MPVRNGGHFLFTAIESVCNQTIGNWELIIVDDNSTDDSIAEAQGRFEDFPIRFLENVGTGIIPALQLAYKEARGDFISRMDADDLMPPQKLEKLYAELKNCQLATGLVKYFSDEPISKGYMIYQQWLNDLNISDLTWHYVYRECVIASPNWMIRKETFEACGAFENLVYPEDYDLVFRWMANNLKVGCVEEVTHLWREHAHRTSRNSSHYQQAAFFGLKIQRFIELSHDNKKDLKILGTGQKTKLTSAVLDKNGVGYQVVNEQQFGATSFQKNQVLIAIWPKLATRLAIAEKLERYGLTEGQNYWWL